MEQVETAYEVKLEAFNGPLDLLLHLIRKHEINIYDIPIALITRQYLELSSDHEGTQSFVCRRLFGNGLDPDSHQISNTASAGTGPPNLVKRRVKIPGVSWYAGSSSTSSSRKSPAGCPIRNDCGGRCSNGEPEQIPPVREVLSEDVQVFDLLSALQEVLAQTAESPGLEFTTDTLTVQDRINSVIERLEETPALTFAALFEGETDRLTVIVTFLALLELVRMKLVRLTQVNFGGPIRITRTFLAWQSEEHSEGNGASPRIMNKDEHNGGFDGNGIL